MLTVKKINKESCVIGNTLVNTKFGITEISKLEPLNLILSHDGNYHRVSRIIFQGRKKVYVVKGLCFDRIETTDDHLFYVVRKKNGSFAHPEWIPCKKLKKGDLLGMPIDSIIDFKINIDNIDNALIFEDRKIAYKTAQTIMYKTKKVVSIEKKEEGYELSLVNDNNSYYKDGYLWHPIEYIAKTDRYEDVFDIIVEDAHSFVANNCIIHNCQGS